MVSKSILELLKHFNLHFTLYYPRYIIFHRDTKHLVQTLTVPKAKLEQTLNVTLAIPKQTALSGCRPAGEQCSEFHPGIPSVQDVQPPLPWTPRDTELPWQAEEADTCTDTSLWQARPARLPNAQLLPDEPRHLLEKAMPLYTALSSVPAFGTGHCCTP